MERERERERGGEREKERERAKIHRIHVDNRESYCISTLATYYLFYFAQNDVYFILLSFSIKIKPTFLIFHVVKSQFQFGQIKVKRFHI
jgi:hypothetical protein